MRIRPCHHCGTAFPWFAESCPSCRHPRWERCEIPATAIQAALAEGPGSFLWDAVKLGTIDPDHICTYAPIGIKNTETGERLHVDEFRALRDADFAAGPPADLPPSDNGQASEAPADPVEETITMLGRATAQSELIRFLAVRDQRQADLATINKDLRNRQGSKKDDLRNTRRLAERARETLEAKNCPFRLIISGNVVRLIDA